MEVVSDAHNADIVMVDGTSVRVHHCAATLKKRHASGRSRGGLTTKIHALTNQDGLPIRYELTPGQAHDAMARGLEACGVTVEEDEDTLIVHGMGPGGVPGGATARSHIDHRIAMSFLILGLAAQQPVTVDDISPIATSFPGFKDLMSKLGAALLDID